MNNIKRIIASLLTFVLAFSITSCGKAGNSPPTDETSSVSVKTIENSSVTLSETTVSEASEESTTQLHITSKTNPGVLEKSLVPTDKDKQKLEKLLAYVMGYSDRLSPYVDNYFGESETVVKNPGNVVYDSISENSLKNAFTIMTQLGYSSLCEYLKYDCEWEIDIDYPDSETPDPKGKMSGENLFGEDDTQYYYCKVKSKQVDYILSEVLNVKPDHSYVFENKEEYDTFFEKTVSYYNDGYYYFSDPEGGDGAGPNVIIDKMSLNKDGTYSVVATLQYGVGGEYESLCQCNVICGLYNNTGTRLWKLYKITVK